ncbi:DUF3710 domain-containing protein [Nonomuraea sp. NPDC005501]|uniref:DUF3710 domain-containing protein n=1 Tax=Nonomuraea sp. NPDC005501 TaxID=3156884 RepID=UPI0033A0F34F
MFRRRRREHPQGPADSAKAPAEPMRESGPWDSDEPHPEHDRVDLGGLLLPHNPDFDVRLASVGDQHIGVVVIHDDSTLQLQALAAPRSMGLWDEVRIKITQQVPSLQEREGPFGTELSGEITADGQTRQARYLGVDGPRWFLLAVVHGPAAADEALAAPFLDFLRDVVVVRGTEPMAREEPIALRRPNEHGVPDEDRTGLNPFRRGPEISEIR